MNKQVQDALDIAIRDNTFNLSAVESIKAMRDDNERINLKIDCLESHNKELLAEKTAWIEQRNAYVSQESNIKEREASMAKREMAITQLECSVRQPEAVADPYYDPSNGRYLGNLNGNRCDPNSVDNPYGRYGSQFATALF